MEKERSELERILPGLDEALSRRSLSDLEQPASPTMGAFRESGGPGLVIPVEYGGAGADLLSAVRVQRAVGSRSPSLAVATTMHHFSVASLVETAAVSEGMEWMLLSAVAKDNLLLASGFAEGRTGQHILTPLVQARLEGDKVYLNGAKKPCSLSRSMDLLTTSVVVPGADGSKRLAVALVPADAPGLSVRPFWNSPILAGAESDEVVLTDVEVPSDLIAYTETTEDGRLDGLQTAGFVWFELLMTACYLGAVSALVERALALDSIDSRLRADMVTAVESAALSTEGVARAARGAELSEVTLAEALVCRYHVQDVINDVAGKCLEALGGMAFIRSEEIAYLNSACRALAFHPPSRSRMADALVDHYSGEPLRVP